MAHRSITHDQLREVLRYDPATGVFTWRVKTCRKVVVGAVAGSISPDGRIIVRHNRIGYRASRLAWFYMTGSWPVNAIDHKDGNPQNNRFDNLRDVSTAGNIQNQRRAHERNKTSGLLGVSRLRGGGRWRARICTNGVNTLIGWYDTPEQAHEAYIEAKRRLHTTCTI
jgi:hypothetical protein